MLYLPRVLTWRRNRFVPALEPWADHALPKPYLTYTLVKWSEFPPEVLRLNVQGYV